MNKPLSKARALLIKLVDQNPNLGTRGCATSLSYGGGGGVVLRMDGLSQVPAA
jgi:hypothetical protein